MRFMAQLSGNLRDARVATGMTQAEVATRLGLTRPCVTHYETGKRMPNLWVASAMAGMYGVSLDDIVPPVECDLSIDDNQMTFEEDM